MVDVTLIGTAGAVPLPERALSSCVVTLNGRSVLFDCGEGTQTAARKHDVNLMRTDVIALTHYHGDHIFGIPGLLQSMNLAERKRPVYIVGPVRAGGTIFQELAPVLTLAGNLDFELRPLAMPAEGIVLSELFPEWPSLARLDCFLTDHRVTSCGYVFSLGRRGRFLVDKALEAGAPKVLWHVLQEGSAVTFEDADGNTRSLRPEEVLGPDRKGIKIVFSGDTRFCGSLCDASKDADLLMCDSTYGSDDQEETAYEYCHMTFSQAGRTARLSGAKRLWLTHFSQRMNAPEEFLDNALAEFPGAECGFDGKTVSLDF